MVWHTLYYPIQLINRFILYFLSSSSLFSVSFSLFPFLFFLGVIVICLPRVRLSRSSASCDDRWERLVVHDFNARLYRTDLAVPILDLCFLCFSFIYIYIYIRIFCNLRYCYRYRCSQHSRKYCRSILMAMRAYMNTTKHPPRLMASSL